MIQISGSTFQQLNMWPTGSIESNIARKMINDPTVYYYQSIDELSFEIKLRKSIIISARDMNQSHAQFEIFKNSRCNSHYWIRTNAGGFLLRNDVKPSDGIKDIYLNSSQYAFECATAMIIIYYYAVLDVIGEAIFNQLFQEIYLYSWHSDSDLGLTPINTPYTLPGDVVYFNNPDFNPLTSQWRGENAVVLEDGMYFGHGVGIMKADQIIHTLNTRRKPESHQPAYLTQIVTRPSFTHLWNAVMSHRGVIKKCFQKVFHHNQSSISLAHYFFM